MTGTWEIGGGLGNCWVEFLLFDGVAGENSQGIRNGVVLAAKFLNSRIVRIGLCIFSYV
ncbi:hypothetical protein VDG1235_3929 [Verrucomicrobiia bacterium DG1235]|nr:hypothetical protein VDG1235_3929 [Verrucomicrobiae bacterium DG1235]